MKFIEQTGCTERRDRARIAFDDHSRGVGEPGRYPFGFRHSSFLATAPSAS